MVVMQPYFSKTSINSLEKTDFKFFYLLFKRVTEERVQLFTDLFFLHSTENCEAITGNQKVRQTISKYFSSYHREKSMYCCVDSYMFLSIPTKDSPTLAVLTGVDPYFSQKAAGDWLEKLSRNLAEKYLVIKRCGTDLETGLLNSQQFFINLRCVAGDALPSVLLIETNYGTRLAREAKIHTAKAVTTLNNCINGKLPLYYLGHDVFALHTNTLDKESFIKLGRSLLSWLRKDGFGKVHIGLRFSTETRGVDCDPDNMYVAVDEAWSALQTARKKGPFSLYDFELLSNPEKHPLRQPSKSLLAKFRRRWFASEKFSVVQFQPGNDEADGLLRQYLKMDNVICEDKEIYCFLNEQEPEQAFQWATTTVSNLKVDDVKVGVAYYPHKKFKKSATVINCRKALCHATLLGENGAAVFDSLSLNVTGDMYYAEGDLVAAVREYKHGLDCKPSDINLLNSLGATYADMAKHREAHKCFKKVLSLEPDNIMALFNLGLGEDLMGRADEAIRCFERAYKTSSKTLDDVKEDLQFHLGKLYCITGDSQKSATILKSWYDNSNDRVKKGRALQFLGRACYNLGELDEAMTWLQRALRYNEFDAESMGLLGLIYFLNHEGNDISLSLCSKSVDIDSENVELKLYLARVQIACSLYGEAKDNLKKCLRNRDTRVEAQLYYCICYQKEGLLKRSKYWLGRLLKNDKIEKEILVKARKIGEELDAL